MQPERQQLSELHAQRTTETPFWWIASANPPYNLPAPYGRSFKAHQAKGRYPPDWAKTQIPGAIKSLDFE